MRNSEENLLFPPRILRKRVASFSVFLFYFLFFTNLLVLFCAGLCRLEREVVLPSGFIGFSRQALLLNYDLAE